MRIKPRLLTQWRFSVSALTPAILLLVMAAAIIFGFVLWSSANVDRASLERQTGLVQFVIDQELARVPRTQESVALWDEAITNTKLTFDEEWVDGNLGSWLYEYYGLDSVAILNETDQLIYTMSEGVSPAPELFAAQSSVLMAQVPALRALLATGAIEDYLEGQGAAYPQAVDIRQVAGRPAIVSIVPIADDTQAVYQEPGSEFLHLTVSYLDPTAAADLARLYVFDEGTFASEPMTSEGYASLPVTSKSGDVVTFFQWKPARPGTDMLMQTAPILAGAFLIAAILVIAMVHRLWKSSRALEAGRMKAEYQATHDALTGLPNRLDFERQLADAVAGSIRDDTQVALLMLDLDDFKKINDTLGQQAGDELIRAVGQRLQGLFEGQVTLAHMGGDEFALIHAGKTAADTAADLARQAIAAIGKPFIVSHSEAFVGASIGIALTADGGTDGVELSRKAGIALFEAKSKGRNRAVFYEDTMDEALQSRHLIEAELREALRGNDQLTVAFQPLFDTATGTVQGAEALVRWNNPRLGLVSPAHFIPIAERAGLIEGVDEFVLRRSCELGARWPGTVVAVNISPVQLRNPKFADRVFDQLKQADMRPQDLELEITEGILIEEERTALAALHEFRQAGIRIALDDFGTGYSSLNYLKRYPVDRIKIDRSFVGQLARDNVSAAIVQAMVTLAHALNIKVTAEGIETREQMELLVQMGCDTLQGFLLSPPTTPRLLEVMLRRREPRLMKAGRLLNPPEPAAFH
jgi:diguanylate cyclase (GGDEF)-like protein